MADISNILYVVVNDAGQVEEMKAMSDTDSIATSSLDPSARQAITEVRDSSSSWASGTDTVSAGVVAQVILASGYTDSASGTIGGASASIAQTSASLREVSAYTDSASGAIGTTSALAVTNQTNIASNDTDIAANAAMRNSVLWTSGYTTAASGQIGTTSALAVTNQTNVATLDGSAAALNTHVNTQGVSIATNTTNISFNDADITTIQSGALRIRTLIGGVSGTSGTDFLGGATPTLSNNLDANGNDILSAYRIKSSDSGSIVLSSTNTYLLGKNDISLGTSTNDFSSLIDTLADLAHTSGTSTGGSSTTASGLAVFAGSSVYVSGAGNNATAPPVLARPGNGWGLKLDTENAVMVWKKSPFQAGGTGQSISLGDGMDSAATFNLGGADLVQTGTSKIIGRYIHTGQVLSGAPACVTTLDSSASISGCPFPPPFSYLAAGADLGTGVANFYFGSGVSVVSTTMGTDGIAFDSTNGYWDITEAGWYEVRGDIAQNVTVSPTTVTNMVVTTTGYGGTESVKSASYSVLRTNIDPHLSIAHWMGYLVAGVKVAIKCVASAGTMKSEKGSTASVKRIG